MWENKPLLTSFPTNRIKKFLPSHQNKNYFKILPKTPNLSTKFGKTLFQQSIINRFKLALLLGLHKVAVINAYHQSI